MSQHLRVLLVLAMAVIRLPAQESTPSSSALPEPQTVAYCDLAKDPAAYNHKLVRIPGFVTYGFEDFELSEPDCLPMPHKFSLWLMYGGKAESGTMYCCPGEGAAETRTKDLRVEGIPVPLLEDATLQRFRELLKKERNTTVRATLVGYFFSGTKQDFGSGPWWGGAGHLGCCSLLGIQRVETFEPHRRADVDYTADGGWYEEEGCKSYALEWKKHVSVHSAEGHAKFSITEQRLADWGARPWAFTDPQRVAFESTKLLYAFENPVLKKVRESAVRKVYRWKRSEKTYVIVVVTRPYWLSFYADSDSVVWVSTMIKEAQCN